MLSKILSPVVFSPRDLKKPKPPPILPLKILSNNYSFSQPCPTPLKILSKNISFWQPCPTPPQNFVEQLFPLATMSNPPPQPGSLGHPL